MVIKMAYKKDGKLRFTRFVNHEADAVKAFQILMAKKLPIATKKGDEKTKFWNSSEKDWFLPAVEMNETFWEGDICYDVLTQWRKYETEDCFVVPTDSYERWMRNSKRMDFVENDENFEVTHRSSEHSRRLFITSYGVRQDEQMASLRGEPDKYGEVRFEELMPDGKIRTLSMYRWEE